MPLMRRFRDSPSGACSYLLGSVATRQAVLIDPVAEHVPLYLGVLGEIGFSLACVLETHLHADHLSGAGALRELAGAALACEAHAGIEGVDIALADGDVLRFGEIELHALATPGHTPHCLTYRWGDRLFTGDSLLIAGCGSTDEPGGNPGQLFDSICRRLLVWPDEYLVFPGHGSALRWVSCIGEERAANPMLFGVSRDEFIAASRRHRRPPDAAMEHLLAANRGGGRTADAVS